MKKKVKTNLERLGWIVFSWILIFIGAFVDGLLYFIPIATFIIGNILGQLGNSSH